MADILTMADQMQFMIDTMQKMYDITLELSATTQDMAAKTRDLVATTNELRDHIADFDDFFRPIRNYFYWEPHCFDIPICWSLRSIFDSLDGIDATGRQDRSAPGRHRQTGFAHPAVGRAHPADHRHHEDHQGADAVAAQHVPGDARPDGGDATTPPWRWAKASTRPRTMTCSTCPRRPSTTPTSSAA